MIIAESKEGINRILVYQDNLLVVDKEDSLTFIIDNEHLKYKIRFTFSPEGEKYSTVFWKDVQNNYIHYKLNNWDSSTWVEISKPIVIEVAGSNALFWMKFRNESRDNQSHRKFDLSIWKEVINGQ